MKAVYQEWIDANIDELNNMGACSQRTTEMQQAFPELRRVAGFYYSIGWGQREHFWLETEDGEIIDPTAMQFPCKGNGVYERLSEDEILRLPIGMCANCGEPIYRDSECTDTVCSRSCAAAYVAYCTGRF